MSVALIEAQPPKLSRKRRRDRLAIVGLVRVPGPALELVDQSPALNAAKHARAELEFERLIYGTDDDDAQGTTAVCASHAHHMQLCLHRRKRQRTDDDDDDDRPSVQHIVRVPHVRGAPWEGVDPRSGTVRRDVFERTLRSAQVKCTVANLRQYDHLAEIMRTSSDDVDVVDSTDATRKVRAAFNLGSAHDESVGSRRFAALMYRGGVSCPTVITPVTARLYGLTGKDARDAALVFIADIEDDNASDVDDFGW